MIKSSSYLLVFISLMIVSVACKGSVDDNFSTEESEAFPNENIIITFATYQRDKGLYEPLMNTFHQQNPEITVQFVALPETGGPIHYRTLASAADTTLIYGMDISRVGRYFLNLRPLMDADATFQPADFWLGMFKACTGPDESVFGIPVGARLTGIFLNERAFEVSGTPSPALGWTWNDFQQIITTLSRKNGDHVQYGFVDQNNFYSSILAPLVDAHLNARGGKLDVSVLENELQWYLDMVSAQIIYPLGEGKDGGRETEQWAKMFINASPAMWVGELFDFMPGYTQDASPDNPFVGLALEQNGFMPFPVSADGIYAETTPIWTQCAAVSAGTSRPGAAWKWVDFLSRQWLVHDHTLSDELLQIPVRMSVAESEGYWKSIPDHVASAVRFGLEHGWYSSFYPQAMDAVYNALIKTIAGETDFTSALTEAENELAVALQPTQDTNPIVVATPQPPPNPDPTLLTYYFNPESLTEVEAIKTLVDEFQLIHPDISIRWGTELNNSLEQDPWESLPNQYDCFTWNAPDWGRQNPQGLLGLNALLDTEPSSFQLDFYPGQLALYQFDHEIYGLPAVSQPLVISYNEDLLTRRGLEPPSRDWTFDDFVRLISEVASTTDADRSYGYVSTAGDTLFFEGRNVQGFDLSLEPPVAQFDQAEMVSTLSWLRELSESGAVLFQFQGNWEQVRNAVMAGQVAFWASPAGESQSLYFFPDETANFKIGVVPMPITQGIGGLSSWSSSRGYFISRQAESPQACWTWIKFLSEQANAILGVPSRRSVTESETWEAGIGVERANVYRSALLRVENQTHENLNNPIAWPLSWWQSQMVVAVLQGRDPEQVVTETQNKATLYLACISTFDAAGLDAQELQDKVTACTKQATPDGSW